MNPISRSSRCACRRLLLAALWLAVVAAAPSAALADGALPQPIILSHNTPTSMPAGDTAMVTVSVHNVGETTWPADGPVRLSYHWLDEQGAEVTFEGLRTMPPRNVAPGEAITLTALVDVPREPGEMVLQWQMLEEGVVWLDQPVEAPACQSVVSVRRPGPWAALLAPPDALPRGMVVRWVIFCLVNLGHVALHLWLGLRPPGSRYARLFEAWLLCLGSLYAALHLAAFVVGLGFWRGLTALLAVDGLVAWLSLRVRPAGTPQPPRSHRLLAWTDIGAWLVAVLAVAVGLRWLFIAARITALPGIDAQQYHLPHALHYANGHSPWGLLPTPDLYPMSTSLLAAWLLLPLRSLSLVELANLPLFMLTLLALGELTRLVQGPSGWRWGVMLGLLLMMAPLGQVIVPFAADLSYTAFMVTLTALAMRTWFAHSLRARDSLLLALSAGLLLGCKASGAIAVASILGLLALALAVRRLTAQRRLRLPSHWPLLLPALLLLVLAGGGVWQVRNWVVYGSPLAPSGVSLAGYVLFPGSTLAETRLYCSVLGDVQGDADYHLGAQTLRYLIKWLGAGYLWLALGLLGYGVDLLALTGAGRRPAAARRVALLLAVLVLTCAQTSLLVRLPWTSLEPNLGLSLRYVMPILMLLGVSLLLGPLQPPRQRTTPLAHARAGGALLLLVALCAGILTAEQPSFALGMIGLDAKSLLMASVMVGAVAWVWYAPSRLSGAALALLMLASVALASQVNLSNQIAAQPTLAVRHHRLQTAIIDTEMVRPDQLAAQIVLRDRADADQPWRVFRLGADAASRPVFRQGRFIYPLMLHDQAYRSQVYDLDLQRRLAIGPEQRSAPGDYLLAEGAVDRAWLASHWLKPEHALLELGTSGRYVVSRVVAHP